jgi:hypothetical protein
MQCMSVSNSAVKYCNVNHTTVNTVCHNIKRRNVLSRQQRVCADLFLLNLKCKL